MPFQNPQLLRQIRTLFYMASNAGISLNAGTRYLNTIDYTTTTTFTEPGANFLSTLFFDAATAGRPQDNWLAFDNFDGYYYFKFDWYLDVRCTVGAANPAFFAASLYINKDAVETAVTEQRIRITGQNDRQQLTGNAIIAVTPDGASSYSWSMKVRHQNVGGALAYVVSGAFTAGSVVRCHPLLIGDVVADFSFGIP